MLINKINFNQLRVVMFYICLHFLNIKYIHKTKLRFQCKSTPLFGQKTNTETYDYYTTQCFSIRMTIMIIIQENSFQSERQL